MPDDIIGLDVLEARLNALSKKLNKDEFLKSAERGMTIFVEGPAKRRTAIDTGRLRNSETTSIDDDTVITGTNVEYGPYVEFGTARQSPQPFMRPAWDEGKGQVVEYMEEEAQDNIKEVIR